MPDCITTQGMQSTQEVADSLHLLSVCNAPRLQNQLVRSLEEANVCCLLSLIRTSAGTVSMHNSVLHDTAASDNRHICDSNHSFLLGKFCCQNEMFSFKIQIQNIITNTVLEYINHPLRGHLMSTSLLAYLMYEHGTMGLGD